MSVLVIRRAAVIHKGSPTDLYPSLCREYHGSQASQVKVLSAGSSDNTALVILTVVLVACVVGILIATVTVYCLKKRSNEKAKVTELKQTEGENGNEASADYQDLCRQRMATKSDKPEPLTRVSSVAASDGAQPSPSSRSSTSSWSEEPVQSNMDISTGHVVLSYMEDHLNNKDRMSKEWEALCSYEADPCNQDAGKAPENENKNRVKTAIPYDHTRVKLTEAISANKSDYINASAIMDIDPRAPAYIATQAPLANTLADFWQMIWEQGSVVIVNLTHMSETDINRCRYWPDEGSALYHFYEVHLVSEHVWCEDYLVRSFYLKNLETQETRTVTQFHFLTWPETGVPPSPKSLLEFRRKVNKSFRGRACPIVVHCSDGVGRTGTYCLLDLVLTRMLKGVKELDIAATLEHIRDQRPGMVQTQAQFEFALTAVVEEVNAILKALPQ
ncbi:receptor-type tyrosine-protein phosphatase N2-like [Lytechinus variegatus]|uniref:receptor-type tyrosine-protein phosphatase N2-like n=1 Tax=Lytechinus variegatus TaxID=7654 RepID=UPI001BB240C4|nr:receptor-type tyrosine-protein phosphatase N2-like [Lytechinus variegatus]